MLFSRPGALDGARVSVFQLVPEPWLDEAHADAQD